ncbi:hypothetical protein TNCV_1920421 [Trichonephila clavipes]|nr:hypothetical protein TNCV_1920421 [Trichonephila clavipes]
MASNATYDTKQYDLLLILEVLTGLESIEEVNKEAIRNLWRNSGDQKSVTANQMGTTADRLVSSPCVHSTILSRKNVL